MTYQSQRVRSGKRGIRTYHSLSYVPDQLGPGHEAVSLDKSSCLENSMDREAWQATVHGVTESWMWLKQLSTHIYFIPFLS